MADKIGRRKVMILTVLNFSLATGLMALTPDQGWLFLAICRFFVGMGVTGLYTVDIAIVQEFVPAYKRGWITGLDDDPVAGEHTVGRIGGNLSGALRRLARPVRSWTVAGRIDAHDPRLGPGVTALVDRQGAARRSAQVVGLGIASRSSTIQLPTSVTRIEKTQWRELFKYPRSMAAACLTGISQTGTVGLSLWMTTLFVLVLRISPGDASFLVIWVGAIAIFGRLFCSWISDAMGRRPAVVLSCLIAAATMSLAGYLNQVYIGTVSVFYVMILAQSFFGSGNYSIVGPYMAEVWPSRLRASGMGLGYGFGNLGKFIGPAGLAVIAGSDNLVTPKATLDALIPAMNYFAVWYLVGAAAIWFIGFETRGRTIAEIDSTLNASPASESSPKVAAE